MGLDQIKKLRELTSLGVNDCKNALMKAKGNFDEALKVLKEKGIHIMEKRGQRSTSQGIIEAYVHFQGNLGALVEVNCETDFVARTDVFKKFAKDIAMQVAATNPKYLKREDIPKEALEAIGDLDKYVKENCLLEQLYVKENKITVMEHLRDTISKTGENITIKRFVYFSLGE